MFPGKRRHPTVSRPTAAAAVHAGSSRLAVALAILAAAASAQSRLWVFEKWSQPYCDGFGLGASWAGDIDRDGFDDIAVLAGGQPYMGELWIYSGRSGTRLRRFAPPFGSYGMGERLAPLGDVSGDGLPDLLVGAPYDGNAGFRAGAAYVVSTKDGSVLHRFLGLAADDEFGRAVAALGDVDLDGVTDFVAGTFQYARTYRGYARVYSGRTGTLIRELRAPLAGEGWGANAAGVGDTDRDGYPDLLVGACAADHSGTDSGSVYLYSGRDWRLLQRFDGSGPRELFGYSVAAAGDVNGDGYMDFVVGAQYHPSMLYQYCGYAKVISGADGATLHLWKSPRCSGPEMDYFGRPVAGVGDVDGDGTPDIAVAAPGITPGRVHVFSGKTGAELWHVDGDVVGGGFPNAVAGGGDANGDGWPDMIVAAPCGLAAPYRSAVWVFSGHHVSMQADKVSLSLSQQESLTFQLDARPVHAAKLYLVLGSLSGTAPGLQLASVRIPLVIDPYFLITLGYPNGTIFTRSLGILNGNGKAQCGLKLVAGLPPALIGLTMQHSFVVVDLASGSFDLAGSAVATKIQP